MEYTHNMKRWQTVLKLSSLLICLVLVMTSCAATASPKEKASSILLHQIELRQQQIAEPTSDRLEIMKNTGMTVDNLEIQRIFIHLTQELNPSQIEELETMGITLYLASWIPPVGTHPTGYILADLPIDRLDELAAKGYVVSLDTAERTLKPESGS